MHNPLEKISVPAYHEQGESDKGFSVAGSFRAARCGLMLSAVFTVRKRRLPVSRSMFRIELMDRFSCIVLILCALQLTGIDRAAAWEGVVVKVVDGDSLQIKRDGRIREIRLYGVDAPEYKQPYSKKAKRYLRRMVYLRTVAVEEMDIDRYDRIVALVFRKEGLVNRELVRAGLAWYYPRYCRRQPLCGELADLQNKAEQQRRGLWRDPDPVSPWEWKRRQRVWFTASNRPGYQVP